MSGEYASPGRGAVPEILREPISERGGASVLAAALRKFRKRKTFSLAEKPDLSMAWPQIVETAELT
jgi:hypothetical protein